MVYEWAHITTYLGQLTLSAAMIGGILPFFFQRMSEKRALTFQVLLILAAFAQLLRAHLQDDFSLYTVWQHSHTLKPWLYKLSGLWSHHEGSLFLWALMLACTGWGHGHYLTSHTKTPLVEQHMFLRLYLLFNTALLIFIIFTCDPFMPLENVAREGQDLNPLLQDPFLAIHPPVLYAGMALTYPLFISFIVRHISALRHHTHVIPNPYTEEKTILRWAWSLLTLGLILGSYWAYGELGWGGWWAWDPVENLALIPWLLATAALHSRQDSLRYSTFASCLLSTWIIRSGLIQSVHSFAYDPERGVFLGLLCTFILIPPLVLAAIIWYRAPTTLPGRPPLLKRLRAMGTYILIIFAAVIGFATLYPVITTFFNHPLTVSIDYFTTILYPFVLITLLLMVLIHLLKTRTMLIHKSFPVTLFITGALTTLIAWKFCGIQHISHLSIVFLTAALIAAMLHPHFSSWRMRVGHAGMALMTLGMSLSLALQEEKMCILGLHTPLIFANHTWTLQSVTEEEGPNYHAHKARLHVQNPHGKIYVLQPEKRFYTASSILHSESDIYTHGLHQFYAVMGDAYAGDLWSFRLYYKPYIILMWLGALMMALAGSPALISRIFKRKRSRRPPHTHKNIFLLIWMSVASISGTYALEPHEFLSNPTLEAQAQQLGAFLLCPQCDGQLLNDSVSEEALELRQEIRHRLRNGETMEAIEADFIHRFGSHVSTKLQWSPVWAPLWIIPILLLLGTFWRYRDVMVQLRHWSSPR